MYHANCSETLLDQIKHLHCRVRLEAKIELKSGYYNMYRLFVENMLAELRWTVLIKEAISFKSEVRIDTPI